MNAGCSENWYALQTHAGTELCVSAQLRNEGILVFLPMQPVRGKRGKAPTAKQRPLFPGYLFCRMSLQSGPRLYKISGVMRIVGTGKQATPIDDTEIDWIRRLIASPYPLEPMMSAKTGDIVRVTAGPFAGMSGSLLGAGEKKKFAVSLSLLNRSVAVTLPAGWITVSTCDS